MTAEPGVCFGIANGALILAVIGSWAARLGATGTAWAAVLAAGLLGIGLSRPMAAWLGLNAWALFTGFVENRFGQLSFAGNDVERLVVFTAAALALSVTARCIHQVIKENGHG